MNLAATLIGSSGDCLKQQVNRVIFSGMVLLHTNCRKVSQADAEILFCLLLQSFSNLRAVLRCRCACKP